MRTMSLEEVRRAVRGRWLGRGHVVSVDGITTDSRTVGPVALFVALRGERFDGHDFLAEAAKAGAVAAMVRTDSEPPPHVAGLFTGGIIGVAETTQALGRVAGYYRQVTSSVSAVGVTGSNGKTTVKRMIHHILSRRLKGTCSPKSYNNAVGVPLTLLDVSPGDDYAICEVGSSAPGEVADLGGIVAPDVAVITSIGPTHLRQLGDVGKVAFEKATLLGSVDASGLAVICDGREDLDRLVRPYKCRVIRFGTAAASEFRLTAYTPDDAGQRFEFNGRFSARLRLPGRHNALNALASIAVAQSFGFSPTEAAEALGDFDGVQMRLERIEVDGGVIINDAYNANPASMAAAAAVLSDVQGARRVFIAGDMLELGEQAEQMHLQTGHGIATRNVDLVVGVGPLGRHIAAGAAKAARPNATYGSVTEAADAVGQLLRRGDAVLIKGSRAMEMERLIEPVRSALGRPRSAGTTKRRKTTSSRKTSRKAKR
ncbi:MAG: UDP-N-acetylmuramoyl-tripeptide--D-alanyl-D-alanine ligase [Phycisphaerae bacterium]|nr:UDP-N-acetylmuramoyl-tripeptide--D-alanyl-D-alanine ligase [Phycisphaerae bacterium]